MKGGCNAPGLLFCSEHCSSETYDRLHHIQQWGLPLLYGKQLFVFESWAASLSYKSCCSLGAETMHLVLQPSCCSYVLVRVLHVPCCMTEGR